MPHLPLRVLLSACVLTAAVAGHSQPLKPAPKAKAGGSSTGAQAKPAGSTAITVGTVTIKKTRIDSLAMLMARARGADISGLPDEQATMLRRMVATNLIGQELLELEARARGLQPTPTEIDSAIHLLKGQFPDAASWQKAMRQGGDTEAGVRAKVARQLRADKLLAAIVEQPSMPSDADVRAFWEKNRKEFPINDSLRAVQILLMADAKMPADDAADKKRRLESIRRELDADSADMTVLLRRFMAEAARAGEGPEARIGGDLERFHPDDFHPDFKSQVLKLKVGQMSPVFRTPLGFHLVLLIEKYDGKFESYRLQSLQNLLSQKNFKMGNEIRVFMRKLAAKYPVKYQLPAYKDDSETGVY